MADFILSVENANIAYEDGKVMQLKDEEYLKRNILSVYYKHYEGGKSFPYYRFIGRIEFETLFQWKKIYFTNPVEWKKSSTGDKNENYLEDWYTDRNNILKAYQIIKQHCMEEMKQYCTQQYIMSMFSKFIGAAALLQQVSFCYCVASTYTDCKMIDEYHTKYKRNIIVKFKNDFFKRLSILSDGKFVPAGTYLYADVMPMVYVNSFDDFIKQCICKAQSLEDIAKNTFDYGAFLKDMNFYYEHETRIKLRMHIENNYNLQWLSNQFYDKNFYMDDEDEIVNNSMLYIRDCKRMLGEGFEDVSDKIKSVGGKQCFELCINETETNEIVDCILLHKNANENEKIEVYKLAKLRNVQIKEIDFDDVPIIRWQNINFLNQLTR